MKIYGKGVKVWKYMEKVQRYENIWKECKGTKIYGKGVRIWKYIERV